MKYCKSTKINWILKINTKIKLKWKLYQFIEIPSRDMRQNNESWWKSLIGSLMPKWSAPCSPSDSSPTTFPALCFNHTDLLSFLQTHSRHSHHRAFASAVSSPWNALPEASSLTSFCLYSKNWWDFLGLSYLKFQQPLLQCFITIPLPWCLSLP